MRLANVLVGRRGELTIRVALSAYFCLAAGTDLWGSLVILPGVAPLGSPRYLQLLTGGVILASAAFLLVRRLSKPAAIVLTAAWLGRTVWDMTGGQTSSATWRLLLPALAIVAAWQPEPADVPQQ